MVTGVQTCALRSLIHDVQQNGGFGMNGHQNHPAALLILLAQDLCNQFASSGMTGAQWCKMTAASWTICCSDFRAGSVFERQPPGVERAGRCVGQGSGFGILMHAVSPMRLFCGMQCLVALPRRETDSSVRRVNDTRGGNVRQRSTNSEKTEN